MGTVLADRRLGFSGNWLKILAAAAMAVDHIGLMFFPTQPLWRWIGRLALPIFAFMIAEGCHHTRSRLRYFLGVAVLGAVCQSAYLVVEDTVYLCVPVSFAISIAAVFSLQAFYRSLWSAGILKKLLWGGAFCGVVAGVFLLTRHVRMDYGFWGCMLPVFASLPRQPETAPRWLRRLDCNPARVLCMVLPMAMLIFNMGQWQLWSLLAVPVLLCYSGRRGRWRMKYFFYIFYPGHLLLLYGIFWLLYGR